MSRTDVFPPQLYSTDGLYTTTSQSCTNPGNWGSISTTHSVNRDVDGAFSRVSQSTPGYFLRVQKGDLPQNAFSSTHSSDKHFHGEYSYEDVGFNGYFATRYSAQGYFPDSFCGPPSVILIPDYRQLNLQNEVKQKVLQKVKDQDVNLAVAWAERDQTLALLKGAFTKLSKAFIAASRGNFPKAAWELTGRKTNQTFRGTLAQNWLELQYGWLPLLSDIFGTVQTMQKHAKKEYILVRSRKRISETGDSSVPSLNGNAVDRTTSETVYEVSVRIKMKSRSVFLKTASELGLTNPALVVWEKVPFSFVVDWAIPIGSFLSQFDAGLGFYFETGSMTTWYSRQSTKYRFNNRVPTGYVRFHIAGSRKIHDLTVIRAGIDTWYDMMSLPYFKNPASLTHVLNALALLTQLKR